MSQNLNNDGVPTGTYSIENLKGDNHCDAVSAKYLTFTTPQLIAYNSPQTAVLMEAALATGICQLCK